MVLKSAPEELPEPHFRGVEVCKSQKQKDRIEPRIVSGPVRWSVEIARKRKNYPKSLPEEVSRTRRRSVEKPSKIGPGANGEFPKVSKNYPKSLPGSLPDGFRTLFG